MGTGIGKGEQRMDNQIHLYKTKIIYEISDGNPSIMKPNGLKHDSIQCCYVCDVDLNYTNSISISAGNYNSSVCSKECGKEFKKLMMIKKLGAE